MTGVPRPPTTPAQGTAPTGTELRPGETRVFCFHRPHVARDPAAAMDEVNRWLGKDRTGTDAARLRVRGVSVTPDGAGGVYTTVVCSGVPVAAMGPRPVPAPPRATTARRSRAATPPKRPPPPRLLVLFVAVVGFLAVVVVVVTLLAWLT